MFTGASVRLHARIVDANPHIATTDLWGIVASVSEDGRKAGVRWSDGDYGVFWTKDLVRIPAVFGGAIRGIGEKRIPLKDRGHKPVPTPPRVIPTPLPGAEPGKFTVQCAVPFWYVPSGETRTTKKGEERENLIPMEQRKVRLTCSRTGQSWVVTGSKRNGRWTYRDSRYPNRPSVHQNIMDAELTRLGLSPASVWEACNENRIPKAEWED